MTLDIAFWRPGKHFQFACADTVFHLGHGPGNCYPLPAGQLEQQPSISVTVAEDGQSLQVVNQGVDEFIDVWGASIVTAGQTVQLRPPCLLKVGSYHVELRKRPNKAGNACRFAVIHERDQQGGAIPKTLLGRAPSSDTLASWFNALSDLQRAAATSPKFYDLAAQAIDHPGGLDRGIVLLRRGDEIQIAASAQSDPRLGLIYRHDLVEEAIAHGRTLIVDGNHSAKQKEGDEAIVVAPIFGPRTTAIGAIYGVRSLNTCNQRTTIRPLEALWVQLVAEAVGAGIQRVAAETTAARTRLMFEQAFTPALVDELLRNPDVLRPQLREITVLFCDLRNSTAIGQRIDPVPMYQLLSEILERLTAQITKSGGVIIDYYGDGLAAMWNAPHDQPRHALLACRAAVAMIGQINALNTQYQTLIGEPLRLGIGIHTDLAHVGNAGSSQRLKYGPRGNMVSLASRLENATKRLLTPILISRNTMEHIRGNADVRKLCQAKLRGISSPVELYELRGLNIDRQRQKLMHDIESMENVLHCLSVDALQDADQAWHSVKTLDELQQEIQNSGLEPEDGRPVPRIVDLTHI